jgi:hypothetical protein
MSKYGLKTLRRGTGIFAGRIFHSFNKLKLRHELPADIAIP